MLIVIPLVRRLYRRYLLCRIRRFCDPRPYYVDGKFRLGKRCADCGRALSGYADAGTMKDDYISPTRAIFSREDGRPHEFERGGAEKRRRVK